MPSLRIGPFICGRPLRDQRAAYRPLRRGSPPPAGKNNRGNPASPRPRPPPGTLPRRYRPRTPRNYPARFLDRQTARFLHSDRGQQGLCLELLGNFLGPIAAVLMCGGAIIVVGQSRVGAVRVLSAAVPWHLWRWQDNGHRGPKDDIE